MQICLTRPLPILMRTPTHAVVDSSRWIGLDILVNFNDVYFMALMFFISGLFLIKSVKRKGQQFFLADRFKRLFIPFLILGTALMLISYAPAYYLSTGDVGLREYVTDFFVNQGWPVGPPWFIWVLFIFNLAFAVSYKKASAFYQRVGKAINQVRTETVLKISDCFIRLIIHTY